MALGYNNLAFIYDQSSDTLNALKYYIKALELYESINDRRGIAYSLNNIGSIYLLQKQYEKALPFAQQSLKLSKEIGSPENIKDAASLATKVYAGLHDYKNALQYEELFILMRDSILNDQTKRAAFKNQIKYEFEKKSAADSVKNAEAQKVKDARLAVQQAQIKQQRFQRYWLIGGLGIIVVALCFVINRFVVARKRKIIIEEQKKMVDHAYEKLAEKNKEVLDSIHYAKRIQTALVTNEKYIHKNLSRLKGL
jgi:tetratricopeptide (TPR) repeat protein